MEGGCSCGQKVVACTAVKESLPRDTDAFPLHPDGERHWKCHQQAGLPECCLPLHPSPTSVTGTHQASVLSFWAPGLRGGRGPAHQGQQTVILGPVGQHGYSLAPPVPLHSLPPSALTQIPSASVGSQSRNLKALTTKTEPSYCPHCCDRCHLAYVLPDSLSGRNKQNSRPLMGIIFSLALLPALYCAVSFLSATVLPSGHNYGLKWSTFSKLGHSV